METNPAASGQQKGNVQKTIDLTLTQTSGSCNKPLNNPVCQFSYHWNFNTNMGEASLDSINGVATGIVLHPLGLAGELAFMSDMNPTSYDINGNVVDISRVILDFTLQLDASAAIMYADGSCMQTTDNRNDNEAFSS